MNEFKTTALNEKYSIPVHKNKADLMAELNNIMGDESDDVEIGEPPLGAAPPPLPRSSKDNEHVNGLMSTVQPVKSVDNANGSKINGSHSMDPADLSDTSDSVMAQQDAADLANDGPMLTWAQNHTQSLSMNVASILSDHDYLSQGDLLRIIESNEESLELEKQSQKQREINENIISNSSLPKDPNTDSQRTIIYEPDAMDGDGKGGRAAHTNDGIEDLNDILQKLKSSKDEEKSALFDRMLEKVNQLKLEAGGSKEPAVAVKKEEPKEEKSTAQNQSNSTSELSSNHSEPMEYHGGPKFSTQSSIEEAKECDGRFRQNVLSISNSHFNCVM